jgi:hypothetical protein
MLEHWYAALHSPHGVIVHTEGGFERVRQQLYQARKESGDLELNKIAICQSPTNPADLWLVKTGRET